MWFKDSPTKEKYIKKNTLIMTPELLRRYLNISSNVKEQNLEIQDKIENLITFLLHSPDEDEFIEYLDDYELLDLLIVLGLQSYELLARLMILLDFKFSERKIKDEKLNELIAKYKGKKNRRLPSSSVDLKSKMEKHKEIRKICAYLLYKMLNQEFSSYYKDNFENGDEHEFIVESIRLNYDLRFSRIIKILNILKDDDKLLKPLSDLLSDIYLSEIRGSQKAREGLSYEWVLKDILDNNQIPNEMHGEEIKETRKWDIYIPTKSNPKIVIEVMYMLTTSSGMTNKIKAIIEESKNQKFTIFVLMDGVGWVARWSDAKKLFDANVYVFTFHKDSLSQAINSIRAILGSEGY